MVKAASLAVWFHCLCGRRSVLTLWFHCLCGHDSALSAAPLPPVLRTRSSWPRQCPLPCGPAACPPPTSAVSLMDLQALEQFGRTCAPLQVSSSPRSAAQSRASALAYSDKWDQRDDQPLSTATYKHCRRRPPFPPSPPTVACCCHALQPLRHAEPLPPHSLHHLSAPCVRNGGASLSL